MGVQSPVLSHSRATRSKRSLPRETVESVIAAARTVSGSHVPATTLAIGSSASLGWPNHCTMPFLMTKKRGLKLRNVPFCKVIMADRSGSETTEYGTSLSFPGWASHALTMGASSSVMAMNSAPCAP